MNTFKMRNNHGAFIQAELSVGEWIEDTEGVYEITSIDSDGVEVKEVMFEEDSENYVLSERAWKKTRSDLGRCYCNK